MPNSEKILIYPKLKRYPTQDGKPITQEEIDKISSHYTGQIFSSLRNQNLLGDKDIVKFMVVKELINSVILNNHNFYHPFTDLIDDILTTNHDDFNVDEIILKPELHPDVEVQLEEITPEPEKPKKPRGRKKKETPEKE